MNNEADSPAPSSSSSDEGEAQTPGTITHASSAATLGGPSGPSPHGTHEQEGALPAYRPRPRIFVDARSPAVTRADPPGQLSPASAAAVGDHARSSSARGQQQDSGAASPPPLSPSSRPSPAARAPAPSSSQPSPAAGAAWDNDTSWKQQGFIHRQPLPEAPQQQHAASTGRASGNLIRSKSTTAALRQSMESTQLSQLRPPHGHLIFDGAFEGGNVAGVRRSDDGAEYEVGGCMLAAGEDDAIRMTWERLLYE